MRRKFLTRAAAALAAVVVAGSSSFALAQSATEFYEGKKIKWVVPYKPGGGYDEYSRLIAPFLGKYTGARVDIVNMPGAGGMKGANEIFNSPSDGLTVGIINGSSMVINELSEIEGANYKVADYNFLGRVVADHRVLVVSAKGKVKTYDDVINSKDAILLGATGLGGSTYLDAVVLGAVMGNKQRVIHGFNSSSDVRQALLRGDIHGMWGSWGSARKGVASGDFHIITHSAKDGNDNTPGIASVFDYADKTSDPAKSLEILNAWDALSAVGRPVAAPPGVPADRVAFLQEALNKAMNDPEFLAKAKKSKRAISYLSGADMNAIAKTSTGMSPDIKKLFVDAIRGEL